MIKVWINKDPKDDRIVAYDGEAISILNPDPLEVENVVNALKKGSDTENAFKIPIGYIRQINHRAGTDFIHIWYGKSKSEEKIVIQDDGQREEIFNYFKNNLPGIRYEHIAYSKFKAAKTPLKVMLALTVPFLLVMLLKSEQERNAVQRMPESFIEWLTEFEYVTLSLVYTIPMLVAIFIALRKIQHPPRVDALYFERGDAILKYRNTRSDLLDS